MGTLVFVCPTSGREVFTGLEIDPASFQGLSKVLAEIKCPDCDGTHNLYEVDSRLVDDGPTPLTTPFQENPILLRVEPVLLVEAMNPGQLRWLIVALGLFSESTEPR